jgi:hypothetical protein
MPRNERVISEGGASFWCKNCPCLCPKAPACVIGIDLISEVGLVSLARDVVEHYLLAAHDRPVSARNCSVSVP